MRYCISFSYVGKKYSGYQIQPQQNTVQAELERAIHLLLRDEIKIIGAGRTDTGVHARKMYAHFDVDFELPKDLVFRLNSLLPADISVMHIFKVDDSFHARFDAIWRTYEYHIATQKDGFSEDFAWQLWRKKLNVEAMNAAAKILLEYEDFACFAKTGADNKTTFCQVKYAYWREENGKLIFTISANRFLRNMVRAIVGTLVEVGFGKHSVVDMHKIIQSKNRGTAGSSVPAHGLFLVDVEYEWQGFLRK